MATAVKRKKGAAGGRGFMVVNLRPVKVKSPMTQLGMIRLQSGYVFGCSDGEEVGVSSFGYAWRGRVG